MIVGFGDSTVRVLSLEPESCLDRVSMQALPASPTGSNAPTAVSIVEMNDQLYLHIGLENGVLLRTVIDNITGGLSDTRSKFIGLEPVSKQISLSKISMKG